jgi:hypothetical protein
MKNIIFLLCGVVLFLLTSCEKKKGSISGSYEMEEGFTLSFGGGDMTLRFVEVVSDSRCPIGSNCGESGQATVRFLISNQGTLTIFELESDIDGKNIRDLETIYGNYEIKFIDLYPYPVLNQPFEDPRKIVFTLVDIE